MLFLYVSGFLPKNRLSNTGMPLGNTSLLHMFLDFWEEPPGDDEYLSGGATMFAIVDAV